MEIYRLNIDTLFGGDDNSPAITKFVEQFSTALYAGRGGLPMLLRRLSIGPDFPMRCLVGLPKEDFTTPRRVLAEAYCQHILGVDVSGLWTTEREWKPTNPNRKVAPLENCVFDIEWAQTLGLPRGRWEDDVLMSAGALNRQSASDERFNQNTRQLLALAIYGFSDPWQFFTANKQPR